MTTNDSRVTIHMAMSLDGFIARKDGSIDWMHTSDEFAEGKTMDPEFIAAFLASINCYVMGSRTYEMAVGFEQQGQGWAYGDTPVVVLTSRDLPRTRDTVEFRSGDLAGIIADLRSRYRRIWCGGGPSVAGELLRKGLADEVSCSVLPVLIGEGLPFFDRLDRTVALHLSAVNAYKNGVVELKYEVTQS
jgi:dihydrofolate reductase